MGQLDNSRVYINKVGTFGVNCASYWWARVAACGIRATHHLLKRCPIDMLLYADDFCYLTALAYPFKWSKTREARPLVAPVGCAREIAHDKCGRYLLGRYRDRPSVQKGTVLSARVLRTSPLTSTSGGAASGMVVGFRE